MSRRRRRKRARSNTSEAASPPTAEGTRLGVEWVPVNQLIPWGNNPRRISRAALATLQRGIRQYGFVQPIVVRRQNHQIIAGHQRMLAAQALGMPMVPVIFVDISEAQAKVLALGLNRIAGEWDLPKLGELLEELRTIPEVDLGLTGFDDGEIDNLLSDLERQNLPGPYEETFLDAAEALQAERLSAPTRVRPGDTWRLGRHVLHCGDSLAPGHLSQLLEGRKADYVLTDPPYGVSYQSTLARRGQRKQALENDSIEGFDDFLRKALPAVREAMKPGGVLHWFAGAGGPEPVLGKAILAITEHFELLDVLVWDKVDPGLGWRWRRSWEAIIEASLGRPAVWHGGRELRNILRFPRAIPGADEHPTPKPIPLLEQLIRATAPVHGLILDPFAGAGSTLIAAERTGRSCCAIEIERRYCDLTLARWEALAGGKAVRVTGGEQ